MHDSDNDSRSTNLQPHTPPRHFGDDEISEILKRAADLQERSSALTHRSEHGLTLEEIRQVAREAGIDPRFVDIAVADANAPVESKENKLIGGPTQWRFQTTIEGEIDDRDRELILIEIRQHLGQKGALEDVYGRMEWTCNDGMGPVMIGITSRDGQTQIDLTVSRSGEPALYFSLGVPFGGLLGGALTAAATGLSGGAILPFVGGASVVCYAFARTGWRYRSRKLERRYTELVERLTMIVQRQAKRALPSGDAQE